MRHDSQTRQGLSAYTITESASPIDEDAFNRIVASAALPLADPSIANQAKLREMLVQLTRTSLLVIFQGRRATADDVQDVQNAIADYRTASDKLIATTLRLRVLTYQPPGPRSHEETQAWRTQNCGERWLAGLDQWLSSESKFPKKRGGRRQPSREDHLQRFLRFYEHAFGTRAAYPASGAQPHVDFVKSYFHTINDFLAHSDFEFEEDRTRVLAYWTVDDEHGTLHDRIIKAKYKGVMPIADSTVL